MSSPKLRNSAPDTNVRSSTSTPTPEEHGELSPTEDDDDFVPRLRLGSLGKPRVVLKDQKWHQVIREVAIPFLFAGIGMVCAGILLDHFTSKWEVYSKVGELLIMTTPLLGLKGDLEMTLASRLSTHANLGNLNKHKGKRRQICVGNLILDQLQAILCGVCAAAISLLTGLAVHDSVPASSVLLLTTAAVLTGSCVSILLGSLMVSVILICTHFRINPDNVATPVAGSLGDVVTLTLLSVFARALYLFILEKGRWFLVIPWAVLAFYAVLVPLLLWLAYRNEYTNEALKTGWAPVLISVVISTFGGLLLDIGSKRFPNSALYQPIINGVGGNLAGVQASRICSYMHAYYEIGVLPNPCCQGPVRVFFRDGPNSVSALTLLLLSVPGHLLFATMAHFCSTQDSTPFGFTFLAIYVLAAVLQAAILLFVAKILVNIAWSRGVDPDTTTIPYLTALGDFLGSGFLWLAFETMKLINPKAFPTPSQGNRGQP